MKRLETVARYSVPILAVIAASALPPPMIFLPFIALALIYAASRWGAQALLVWGGSAWLASAALLQISEDVANQVSVYGYWLLVAGTLTLIIGLVLHKESTKFGKILCEA